MYVPWHSTVANLNKVYGYFWASWTKELQKRNLTEWEDRNKASSQEKFYVGKYNRYWIMHIGVFIVWKLILPLYVVTFLVQEVHKLIEHAVAKEREMINNDDGREDSEGKFWCAPWGERAAILSFQTGICSNIGHGLIVWGSRYLDRGGDQETSKGTCFLALKIRKIIAISW